jgi:hypothetical protein
LRKRVNGSKEREKRSEIDVCSITWHEIPLPRTSPKTGHEEPQATIERGTPQDCVGTEQAEEY